jgi:hypothetical protein
MNFLDVIILLGAIQGFIISCLLYFKKEKLYANKLLAALLFLLSLACLNLYLLNLQITKDSTFWSIFSLIVPMVIIMPIGPLIYFYIQSLQTVSFKLNRSHRVHLYSVIIDLLPSLIGIVFVLGAMNLLNGVIFSITTTPMQTFPAGFLLLFTSDSPGKN